MDGAQNRDLGFACLPPRGDAASFSAEDRKRAKDGWKKILARLRQGPATNRDLSDVCFSYRQRVSDLRKRGFTVICDDDKENPGRTLYTLVEGEQSAPAPPAEQPRKHIVVGSDGQAELFTDTRSF